MRKKLPILLICMGMLALLPLLPPDNAAAAEVETAKLDKVVVTANPPQQLRGVEVEITAEAFFYGGCCYWLYSRDIIPRLELPPEVTISSGPFPEKYDQVDAPGGGDPRIVPFTWKVASNTVGDYQIKVNISTKDSGGVESVGTLRIMKGPSISTPTFSPSKPEKGSDLKFEFSATSPTSGVDITKVEMYYLISKVEYKNLTAQRENVTTNHGGVIMTVTGTKIEVSASTGQPSTYTASIPELDGGGYIYYWVYVEDSANIMVTTPVNKARVGGEESAFGMTEYLIAAFIVLFVIVMVVVFVMLRKRRKK